MGINENGQAFAIHFSKAGRSTSCCISTCGAYMKNLKERQSKVPKKGMLFPSAKGWFGESQGRKVGLYVERSACLGRQHMAIGQGMFWEQQHQLNL